jgi:hypothetical protein
VLIRGAQIDGSGLVGFGENPLTGHLAIATRTDDQ